MRVILLTSILILLFGCGSLQKVTRAKSPENMRDFKFSYVDNIQYNKFYIEVSSLSIFPICMTHATWPTSKGELDGAHLTVFVVVNGVRFPYKNYELNYCPFRECAVQVKKGEKIEAAISYDHFDLPQKFYGEHKELIFYPSPFWCDKGDWMN